MAPEYLEELAKLADPSKLWRRAILDRLDFTSEQKQQLDTGVALRRHASHGRRLNALLGTGKSLLVTPLSLNGVATKTVPIPDSHAKLLADRMTPNRPSSLVSSTVVSEALLRCAQLMASEFPAVWA